MKIELSENTGNSDCILSEFPDNGIFTGTDKDTEEFKIFIKQKTLNAIDDHLSSDIMNELGGVMTGDYCINSSGEKFIKIDGYITAMHTQSSSSRLTFTHETWSHINSELELKHSGKKILGWYHSHPGHTVFFSNFDVFIQENFFNMEYMVAYVFDPTIKERGFFYWKENKTVKASGFYIYEAGEEFPENNTIDYGDVIDKEESLPVERRSLMQKILKYFPFVLAGLNLILMIFLIYSIYQINGRINALSSLETEMEILKHENEKLSDKVDELIVRKNLEKFDEKISSNENKNSGGMNSITDNKVKSEIEKTNQEKALNEKKTGSPGNVDYTVKPGDTIEKILIMHNINRERMNDILMKNNIKKTSDLKIGMVIQLPVQ